jgi:FtsP/CotA-like multicopper oxidase with cupredoxin domain
MQWLCCLLLLFAVALQRSAHGLAITARQASADSLNGIKTGQLVLSPKWNVNAPSTVRRYDWTLSERKASPGGLEKTVLTVNGQSPGPLIEANLGDTVEVHIINQLSEISAIHWHGQAQNGTNHMDGALGITDCGISPGTSFTYRWTVQTYGTYWWHAHSGFQYTEGLRGPIVLHSPDDPYSFGPTSTSAKDRLQNTTYDGDQIMIANDLYNEPAKSYMSTYMSPDGFTNELGTEPVPDCGTVNGHGVCHGGTNLIRSNMSVYANERYRFRLINAGTLGSIRFSLQGHTMTVIEADGTLIEPQIVQSVSSNFCLTQKSLA